MSDKERSRERSRRERPTRFSENSRDRSPDRGRSDRASMKSSNNRVYVSNIPYEYRWQDMKDLFRSQVGDVLFVELFVDENDKPKGCGIVEFSDAASVEKCLEVMQRFEVKTRKLIVREDSGNVRDKHGNIIGGGSGAKRNRDDSRYRDDRDRYDSMPQQGAMRQDDVKWGNTYGLSPHFLESLSIDAPLCNKIFVANLEYNIEKKKLKEVFRLAGKVLSVDIPLDKDGRSRGFAVIEYDHPVEAVQAISMFHGQFLYDRPMTVRMDRANETFKLPEGLKSIGMGLGTNGEPLKNVAHNLPSLSCPQTTSLLGAVPNTAIQFANALQGLGVGSNALSNLASNPSVLQAAGLASNLLGNGLTGDLSSLVSSPAQNPSVPQVTTSNTYREGFAQGQSQNPGYATQAQNFRNYQSFDSQRSNYNAPNDRGFGTNSSMHRSPGSEKNNFSRKVLVSNLPPTASYKLLHDKLVEFGEVLYLEEKGNGKMVVEFNTEWQAESAIKGLNRARLDGRVIEAGHY